MDLTSITAAALPDFVRGLPKAELHLHIEGTLEPELIFALAEKNAIRLPYADVEALRAAYAFSNLQSFLDVYYAGASVLQDEDDFYQMGMAYLRRAQADNIIHAEIFFDPQTHTERGIEFATVINGLRRACDQAETEFGIKADLILCFLRHLDEAAAFATLEQSTRHIGKFIAVGLDSSELGNPPEKFARVFKVARMLGLHCVAHAGEEGPPEYIRDALDLLEVKRIDHGVQVLGDPALVERLVRERIPLTVCPLSNVKLRVFPELAQHNLKKLLDAGLLVTINSDDPAYFGGYLNQNFVETVQALGLGAAEAVQLADNSFTASFASEAQIAAYRERLAAYCAQFRMELKQA